jgi:hypothetical protein
MIDELGRLQKKVVVAQFGILSRHLVGAQWVY